MQAAAQGAGAGAVLCSRLRAAWDRGSGPAPVRLPYPAADTAWAPTDCWGGSGGGPASETDRPWGRSGAGGLQGAGAPGGLYPREQAAEEGALPGV